MGVRRVAVSWGLINEIFTTGSQIHSECIEGLPSDASPIALQWDSDRSEIVVLFRSSEWEGSEAAFTPHERFEPRFRILACGPSWRPPGIDDPRPRPGREVAFEAYTEPEPDHSHDSCEPSPPRSHFE